MKIQNTYKATIHVGLKVRDTGEIQTTNKAKEVCQKFVDERGECVSFTNTKYIYTNGNEPGLIIEFIQYPRFPREEEEILSRALELAQLLKDELSQYKVSIITKHKTYMI